MMDTPLYMFCYKEYIPPSLLTFCNFLSTMFHFGDDYLCPTKDTLHDPPSLASPKWQMASSFSWTSLFKSPTSGTSCLVTLHLQSSIKSSCCVKLNFISPNTFLFVTLLFILELHFCSHSRLHHTSQRCVFKTNILQPQLKYNQKKLKMPHLSILPRSTSHCPWN